MPAKKPAKRKTPQQKPARKPARAKAKAKAKPRLKSKTVRLAKKPVKKPAKKPRAAKPPAPTVDALLRAAKHPFEAEVNAVRKIIKDVHTGIAEEWKWAAPSLSYKGYLATFNLWQKAFVQLIFHNGALLDPSLGIFEGAYPDRRLVNFASMADVRAKQPALVKAVREWVKLMDAKG